MARRSGCVGIVGLGAVILVAVAIAQGNTSSSSPPAPTATATPVAIATSVATPTAVPKPTAKPAPPPPTSGFNKTAAKAAGATAICRDGSWSYSAHRSGTCSRHGGVYWWTGNVGPAG